MSKVTKKTGVSSGNTGTRANFSGKLGFVLATAGSAVGLGNIWRFPYLTAKYGGGMFVLVYILLAFTFGYTMMVSEEAIGRLTQKSPVGAFRHFSGSGGAKFGGWVTKYLAEYALGDQKRIAGDSFFPEFISNAASAEIWFLIFAAIVILVILGGVESGVERVSKFMMPVLVILAAVVMIYSITRPGAMAGVKYMLVPDLSHFSIMTVVAAMGQMFYSLSIAMGILYTYGSYMKKEVNIESATCQVAIFDSGIAIMAGLMIIPAVFAFYGGAPKVLNAGPSLMFITLPKVFASMGLGRWFGLLFFVLVLFAAVTSAISLAETSASTFQDELGWSRKKACGFMLLIMIVLGSLSSLGYSTLSGVTILGMAILDFFDFLTNSVMMPVAAFMTCLLVVRVAGTRVIEEEVTISSRFRMKKMYNFVIRYLAPVFLVIILISSVLNVFGVIRI